MDIYEFLKAMLSFVIIIPAAVLCFLPMKNQLRFPLRRTIGIASVFLPCLIVVCAAVFLLLGAGNVNFILLPALAVCLIAFKLMVKTDFSKLIFVFVSICSLVSFPSIFAYMFDSMINPELSPMSNTWQANIIQLSLCIAIGLAAAYPLQRYYSWIIDNIDSRKIWYSTLIFPIVTLSVNIYSIPVSYENMQVGNITSKSLYVLVILLIVFLLFYFLFYIICRSLTEKEKLTVQNRILEMQKSQHQSFQSYLEETAKLRHDFKHSVHLMHVLADEGDIDGLKKHMDEYEAKLNIDVPKKYCSSSALNALLNYYGKLADNADIRLKWKILLPPEESISEFDLCCLLGNIVENAINGCETLKSGQRYFNLTVKPYNNCLYIVSTNNFGGKLKKSGDRYLSTKINHGGIGLLSVQSMVAFYNGVAEIEDSENKFMVNIMLRYKN